MHALTTTTFFLIHLTLQEVSIIIVNVLDFVCKSLLFLLVVLFIASPHESLLIIELLLDAFSHFLFIHLSSQVHTHVLLLILLSHHARLILHSHAHFALKFIFVQILFFMLALSMLTLDNIVGQVIHKELSTLLALLELTGTIFLLLIKHTSVLFLSLDVIGQVFLLLSLSLSSLSLILGKHFLEIFTLLTSLLNHGLTLLFHLIL
mmetsp:Transcript_114704/g.159250  ORF Transcript_114704/g.159250 Transcript_114704/m.159250 type:complete len:206 (-) Transcript_114704:911-1528(-)